MGNNSQIRHAGSLSSTLMKLATRLSCQKTVAKSLVISRVAGEGENESLREFYVKEASSRHAGAGFVNGNQSCFA